MLLYDRVPIMIIKNPINCTKVDQKWIYSSPIRLAIMNDKTDDE